MIGLRDRTTHGTTGDASYGRADARRPALDQSRHGMAGVAVAVWFGVGVVSCPELDTVQNSLAGALPLTPSVL